MSKLAALANDALQQKRLADAAALVRQKEAVAQVALKFISKSPLGRWFPGVEWEYIGTSSSSTTYVREKGEKLILGVKGVSGDSQGPEVYEVGVYEEDVDLKFYRVRRLASAADLGAYLEEPQAAPASCGVAAHVRGSIKAKDCPSCKRSAP